MITSAAANRANPSKASVSRHRRELKFVRSRIRAVRLAAVIIFKWRKTIDSGLAGLFPLQRL